MAEKVREASARGDAARLSRLLEDGFKPFPDENGKSPLLLASAAGHVATCDILIGHGVDVNAADNTGVTPLQRAAAEGHLDVVELLLKHGADVGRQDIVHGNSALHECAWRGYSRTVAALAKALGTRRAPLHARNLAGFAPLHLACQNGHNQSCRELLLAGCNPDLQNNYGDTPLHTSARYGHAGVTRILISALCRVSDRNKNGDTALHIAAAMGRRKLTRILLEAGCERGLRNKQSETAKDIARRKNLTEILEIINKSRSKSRSRSKGRDESRAAEGAAEQEADEPKQRDSKKGDKKREKTESGTSGSRDGGGKKEKKKHKAGGGNKGTQQQQQRQHKVHFEKALMGREWSPYGCHYYPDPEAFPQPRLDSLPSDPLARGEQYYLDLAGNIRKGPVGVGYTCYCAPFFRHMEAKLERDKAELKARIDQAHERLDLKVANLERRTRGQISELTRCVAAERSKCEERHVHLRRWISRGGQGRHSERPPRRNDEYQEASAGPARARSLEDLLDDRPQDRSFEIPGETCAHRRRGSSLDHLDIPAIPRCVESVRDAPCSTSAARASPPPPPPPPLPPAASSSSSSPPIPLRVLDLHHPPDRPNETSFVVGRDRSSPLGAAASPTVGLPGQRVFQHDQRVSSSHEILPVGRQQRRGNNDEDEEESGVGARWTTASNRGSSSVHEMIKRFQQVPAGGRMRRSGWYPARSVSSEPTTSPDHSSQCSQGQRVQPQGIASNGWHPEGGQENESESSEGEDDPQQQQPRIKQINKHHSRIIGDTVNHQHYESIEKMPYRSRSGVYSPTSPPHDAHNDSGYSTRIYGSSKGASPSLSGQLECDGMLPPVSRNNFPSGQQLAALLDHRDVTVFERGGGGGGDGSAADNLVINIAATAASLV